jgi:spermidine/putrescine transport system ATP-binding protein
MRRTVRDSDCPVPQLALTRSLSGSYHPPTAGPGEPPPPGAEDARLTTSATPETSAGGHHHDHEIAGPAITAEGLREHAATHAAGADVPDVHISGVTKRFGDVVAVDHMNLEVARGAFYSFLGPSGCGKTTTLRMIAGFEQPTAGEIYLAGEPVAGIPPYRRHVNTVFQHYALFPHMSVAQNVGYGLRQKKVSKHDETHRVGEALELVRLAGYEKRRIWELSGGQQQRVALARALINHPSVLLLDEPLGALDRKLRHEMQIELKQLQREVGITFVYVTHDQEEALTMSDVIVVMNHGLIQQQGDPAELYERPVNRFVAGFIGSSNFIEARLVGGGTIGGDRTASAETASGLGLVGVVTDPEARPAAGDMVTIAIRPERFHVATATGGTTPSRDGSWSRVPGRVTSGTYLGDTTEYRVATDALGELTVRLQNRTGDTQAQAFGPGQPVVVSWQDEAALVLAS